MHAGAGPAANVAISGRYALFFAGRECGEERWRLASGPDGYVITGEQELVAPHPIPSRQEYRLALTTAWRPLSLEILWHVGPRTLTAYHRAADRTWRAQIDYEGQVKQQEGDFPDACEVDYGTHLANTVILARRDFQLGGEHEFPVLRIGPPYMAVAPDRMLYRCVEVGTYPMATGPIRARRYVVTIPPQPEEQGYSFWADEDGFVLESFEGVDPSRTWMKLVEVHRG